MISDAFNPKTQEAEAVGPLRSIHIEFQDSQDYRIHTFPKNGMKNLPELILCPTCVIDLSVQLTAFGTLLELWTMILLPPQ